MVKLWKLTLSTYLVSFSETISLNGNENFVQVHPRFMFEKLKKFFGKQFQTMKNDKEVYMQLQNIQ
jgi:hypothetical protein